MSEPFTILSNDRIFLTGKTGVGKSTAAKRLIWGELKDVIYFDMSGEETGLKAPVLSTLDDVQTALYPDNRDEHLTKFVYRPEMPSYEGFERLCELVYNHGNIHLIADELLLVYRENNSVRPTTDHHLKIMTNGRKVGVGMTGATQRPVNVPLESISESEHIFTFKLKLPKDVKRMEQVCGPVLGGARDLGRYEYYYDHDQLDDPQWCEPLKV